MSRSDFLSAACRWRIAAPILGWSLLGALGSASGCSKTDRPQNVTRPEATDPSAAGTRSLAPPTANGSPATAADTPASACVQMVDAARAFLDSLGDARSEANGPYDADPRSAYEFLPPSMAARPGVSLRTLTGPQREAFERFLQANLSAPGVAQAKAVMALESVLAMRDAGVSRTDHRDPENYFIHVFGEPTATGDRPWGWRFEGHHLSLRTHMVRCQDFAATPAFWGSSGEVDPLRPELDLADAVWEALSESQRGAATAEITTHAIEHRAEKLPRVPPAGLRVGDMPDGAQQSVGALLAEYIGNMAPPVAEDRLRALETSGRSELRFAMDPQTRNFRIQGQAFMIEFVWTEPNHVHSAWRDFDGDFGEDLMQRHLARHHASP